MAQRICFLGRGGSGKSTVAQNLGHALALKGYHVPPEQRWRASKSWTQILTRS